MFVDEDFFSRVSTCNETPGEAFDGVPAGGEGESATWKRGGRLLLAVEISGRAEAFWKLLEVLVAVEAKRLASFFPGMGAEVDEGLSPSRWCSANL